MLGNKLLDMIVAALNILGILACIGVFYYTQNIYQRPLPQNQEEMLKLVTQAKEQTLIELYPLQKKIINLRSSNAKLRFVDLEIHLLPYLALQKELIKNNEAVIYDAMIRIIGEKTPDEINTVAGKILLEERLKKEINLLTKTQLINKIYFRNFVVQ